MVLILLLKSLSKLVIFIVSDKVSGIKLLLIRDIQGCYKLYVAIYRIATLNVVNRSKKFRANTEQCEGNLNFFDSRNLF